MIHSFKILYMKVNFLIKKSRAFQLNVSVFHIIDVLVKKKNYRVFWKDLQQWLWVDARIFFLCLCMFMCVYVCVCAFTLLQFNDNGFYVNRDC